MIELQVIAVRKEGLATEYRLSPDPVIIGAMDSHYEEKLHLALPEEWKDRRVRVTFTPDMCKGVGFMADNDGCVSITAAFSGAAPRGVITVEAFEVDETDGETVTRKTFARDVRYRAIPHAAPGEPPEDITPTQFEQFIANVTAATKDNADAAAASAQAAESYMGDAETYATSAGNARNEASAAEQNAQTAAKLAATSETNARGYAANALAAQTAAEKAVDGFDEKVTSAKEEIDAKVTSANTAIDEKVDAASGYANTASNGATDAVNAQLLAQQAQVAAEVARNAAAGSAQKAADSEFAATNAASTLMSVADDTANAIVLEASGSVVQIAAASRTLKELLVNIDPTLDGRTGTMVTVATDDAEMNYAVDFGKVVYGGTYNWKTRELTETWQAFVFDGSEEWAVAVGETDSLLPVAFKGDPLNIARKNTAICNRYDRGTADGTVGQFWIDERTSTGYNVRFMCDKAVAADITAWTAYLKAQHDAGTPVVLVAEVVEPEITALNLTEMPRSVAPSCSIAATTGDVSLAYVADTKAYVDENSGAGSATEPEVFIAEHSVTTYEEIKAAYDAGKIVLCKYYSYTGYLFVFNAGANYALFYTHEADDCLYKIVCHATQGWTNTRYAHASKEYVDEKVASLELVSIVTELPETGVENKTYFVAKTDGSGMDLYDEYMWINDAWEYIGTKQIEIDLTEYVKNTDYAHRSKAGLVKTDGTEAYKGVDIIDGVPSLVGAVSPLSDAFFNNPELYKVALLSKDIYRWMKVGLTTNTETLTDEEKTAALAWLGALPKAVVSSPKVYGADPSGTFMYSMSANAEKWTIAQRGASGVLAVGTPTADSHATTKAYVDGLIAALESRIAALEAEVSA